MSAMWLRLSAGALIEKNDFGSGVCEYDRLIAGNDEDGMRQRVQQTFVVNDAGDRCCHCRRNLRPSRRCCFAAHAAKGSAPE